MLKLKKLQILGFKSFCDRTELKFQGDGVAAIIGPNGCGKSNIADAISWVLGEQSAKTLRGSRMEDVIFAGTRDRKPTGMAEVSLTLIDPELYDGGDASEPTQIEIKDDLPTDDWDEAGIRAKAAEEVEQLTQEAQCHFNSDCAEPLVCARRIERCTSTRMRQRAIVMRRPPVRTCGKRNKGLRGGAIQRASSRSNPSNSPGRNSTEVDCDAMRLPAALS